MSIEDKVLESVIRTEARALLSECQSQEVARGYDRIAAVCFAGFFTPLAFLIVSWLVFTYGPWQMLACSLAAGAVAGLALYPLLGLIHDGSHGNIPKSAKIAQMLNFVVAPILGVSTFLYRRAHLAHHAFLGRKAKDPQYAPFDSLPEDHESPNLLMVDMPIRIDTPIRNFFSIVVSMSSVISDRESALTKSLFLPGARRELYRKFSFFGEDRLGLSDDDKALPREYLHRQKRLDWMRLGMQVGLLVMLFFHPLRYLSIGVFSAVFVAALLNMIRTSREHSGYENDGDVVEFNRHHSSNTGGSNLFSRYLWFPVPWHALHHVAPRVPFFMLRTLQDRVLRRQHEAAKCNNATAPGSTLVIENEQEPTHVAGAYGHVEYPQSIDQINSQS